MGCRGWAQASSLVSIGKTHRSRKLQSFRRQRGSRKAMPSFCRRPALTAVTRVAARRRSFHPHPSNKARPGESFQVWEQTISSSNANKNDGDDSRRILYRPEGPGGKWLKVEQPPPASRQSTIPTFESIKRIDPSNIQTYPFVHHFLPAKYPESVCSSYSTFASYCMCANIAGSAAMVLSTQVRVDHFKNHSTKNEQVELMLPMHHK